jgi:HlyD family secretion protein
MLGPETEAVVSFNSDPQHPIAGRVRLLHREVDPATREFSVDIALASLPRNWALGQRATVLVRAAGETPVLGISHGFLARRDGRPGVWLNEGGRARWRAVTLGMPAGEEVEIVAGLAPGDIVLDPSGRYEYQPIVPGLAAP